MPRRLKTLIVLGFSAGVMTGCSTVKMPKIDFLKLPEFREDAVNIKDYPRVADAPTAPTDVRSAKAWDDAAKDIIKIRDNSEVPLDTRDNKTDAEVLDNIEALREQAQAYKLDDPQ